MFLSFLPVMALLASGCGLPGQQPNASLAQDLSPERPRSAPEQTEFALPAGVQGKSSVVPIPFQRNWNEATDPAAYAREQLRRVCVLVQPATFALESERHLDVLLFALLVDVPSLEARSVLETAAREEADEFQQHLLVGLLARLETLRTPRADKKLADSSLERSLRALVSGESDAEAALSALSQEASPQALVVLGISLQGASVAITGGLSDRYAVEQWRGRLVEAVRQTGFVACNDYDGGLNSGMRIAHRARQAAETLGGLR